MKSIRIRKPDDMHLHLRQGDQMKYYARESARYFARGLVMPNTMPPLKTPEALIAYRDEITGYAPDFTPLLSFKMSPELTREDVFRLKEAGAIIGKYYPQGATTNSEDGVTGWKELSHILEAMEEAGLVFAAHGEDPNVFSMDRETAFIKDFDAISKAYPKLRMVFEHISTLAAAEYVLQAPERIAASVTVHHLLFTLDDIIGGGLNPHLFCKPVPKQPADRRFIQDIVLSGNPKFFFGSDSAPHLKEKKECFNGAAGAYTAPIAIPILAHFFEDNNALDLFEDFVSSFGAEFYNLPLNEEYIELQQEDWVVPDIMPYGVVPPLAGTTLGWKLGNDLS